MKEAESACKDALYYLDKEDFDSAKSAIKDCMSIVEDYTGRYGNPLEEIRSSNSQLRDNWQECETRIIELESEIEELKNQVAP